MFKKISNKELVEFTRILGLLILSRVSIIQAFELIIRQTKNNNFKEILKKISSNIKGGNSLSKSFAKFPQLFPEIFVSNIKVAEETGRLAEVLNDYTNYQEKIQTLKRKIVQAVRYPVFVILVAGGVLFFMLFFIIPTFESLFFSVKAELPPLTQFLVSMSNFLINNSFVLLLLFLMIIFLGLFIGKSKTIKEEFLDKLIWKIPLISTIYRNNVLARFSLSMGTLLGSKVTLVDSLKISKNTVSNKVFNDQIESILKKIVRGESLSSNIQKSIFFDVTFTRLLAAGEESAELDKVFFMISNYYSNEFDYYLDNITSLLEPALIIFVGVIVAFILVGLYLPMFEIINQFGV